MIVFTANKEIWISDENQNSGKRLSALWALTASQHLKIPWLNYWY